MFSITKPALRVILGLLESDERNKRAVEKPEDVTDQEFGNVVVRELDELKSTSQASSTEDLAAMDSFQEGIVSLYKVLEAINLKQETVAQGNENLEDESEKVRAELIKQRSHSPILEIEVEDLDDSAMNSLSSAKISFKTAKEQAKESFSKEEQNIVQRILGMKMRIAATILENIGSPESYVNATKELGSPADECRQCLKELHAINAVSQAFKVQLSQEKKASTSREETEDIVRAVCKVNHAIFTVTLIEGGDPMFWPQVDIGEEHVDPLRDQRIVQVLHQLGMEHCHGVWTFGQEGQDSYKLRCPSDLTTNALGEFIVADLHDVKIFNSSGKFVCSLCPVSDNKDAECWFVPISVATDRENNVYVLAELKCEKTDSNTTKYEVEWRGVFVFDKHDTLCRKFPIKENFSEGISLTVNSNGHVFVLGECNGKDHVDVYESDGQFIQSFGAGIFSSALYITAADKGRVMVLDQGHQCVHVFSAQGDHIQQFRVEGDMDGALAYNPVTTRVCVTTTSRQTDDGQVEIYTQGGEFLHVIQLDTWDNPGLSGAAVTVDGRFCLVSGMECKVFVL